MDKKDQIERLAARKARKMGGETEYLIAPQILMENVLELSFSAPIVAMYLPVAGELATLSIAFDQWREGLQELCFSLTVASNDGTSNKMIVVRSKEVTEPLGMEIRKPCRVILFLSDAIYDDGMKNGRERIFIPTQFSFVFRAFRSACHVVRS
jgi:hypothetical protein